MKLFIYGDQNRIRSSRRLHRECGRNVELFFLLNRLCPDFRTIADFRKKHHKQLRQILLIFARACRELNILDGESLCLDGTTIRASNGKKRSTSIELSRKKLEYARAQLAAVERYLDTLDENDLHEASIAFHARCIEEMENSGRKRMTFTDPNAR